MDELYSELRERAHRFVKAEEEYSNAKRALEAFIKIPFARPSLIKIDWQTVRSIGIGGLSDEQQVMIIDQLFRDR